MRLCSAIRQVAEAMHYAHRNQVVHCGLNPQALWVTERKGVTRVTIDEALAARSD